jgi:hypothetical protein
MKTLDITWGIAIAAATLALAIACLPHSAQAAGPAPVPISKTVLYYEPGGYLEEHVKRWRALAESGDDVEIRGSCVSACTMILAYIPSNKICFSYGASLRFHKARTLYDDVPVPNTPVTQWMLDQYPPDIRTWLIRRGGVEEMTTKKIWVLDATELWEMGYRKCDAEQLPVPMTKYTSEQLPVPMTKHTSKDQPIMPRGWSEHQLWTEKRYEEWRRIKQTTDAMRDHQPVWK